MEEDISEVGVNANSFGNPLEPCYCGGLRGAVKISYPADDETGAVFSRIDWTPKDANSQINDESKKFERTRA